MHWTEQNGRRGKRGMLAHEVAFVSKIFWRGANERKEEKQGAKRTGVDPAQRKGDERWRENKALMDVLICECV